MDRRLPARAQVHRPGPAHDAQRARRGRPDASSAVDIGLDEAAADALLSGQFETFAALIVGAWETQLTEYLKEAAKKDPTNPFFKGKTEAEINGAVFEICRREDPPPIPPDRGDPAGRGVPAASAAATAAASAAATPAAVRPRGLLPRGPERQGRPARATAPGTSSPRADPMPYVVLFENKPDASAPAHEVRITDQLDASKYDLTRSSSVRCSSATTR